MGIHKSSEGWKSIPRFLTDEYNALHGYICEGRTDKAAEYLYNLPQDIYDSIIDRAGRGYVFETIINKIEELTTNKKTNELFKLNNHDGDNNHLF